MNKVSVDESNTEVQAGTPPVDGDPLASQDPSQSVAAMAPFLAGPALQGEMPFAMVMGQAVTEFPKDLYIPPQALEVFLEAFEGPLDLLLYLIKRQNLDILEIDVSQITEQYMEYVELMDAMQFELAAEYLLMAAMLAEIKSRMLLPRASELLRTRGTTKRTCAALVGKQLGASRSCSISLYIYQPICAVSIEFYVPQRL